MSKPKLRFKEFIDDWEQRKLEDMLSESKIVGNTGNNARKITVKLWGKGAVPKEGTGSSSTQYYKRKSGQLIYSKLDFLNAAFAIIPKELDDFESTSDLPAFDIKDANPSFLLNKFIQKNFYLKFGSLADGSRKAKRVHPSLFLQFVIDVPCVEEQRKIGAFFNQLDKTITLHQRKLEKLKKLKQGLLQKLFPKNDSHFPELRFPEFTAPWEQRKFGEVFESLEYGLNAPAKEFDGERIYLRITDIDDQSRQLISSGLTSPNAPGSQLSKYALNEGDIVFTRTGASVGKTFINKEKDKKIYFAGYLIRGKVNHCYNPDFVFQNTLTGAFQKFIAASSQRSGQPGINAEQIKTFVINVPSLKEQDQISKVLASLDSTITLHQRKIEKLQLLKKGLLQQMFV